MTEQEMKQWIDGSSYETLLDKWRFSPPGNPFFQGEVGQYYKDVMFTKRDALSNEDQVRASKNVGWDKR